MMTEWNSASSPTAMDRRCMGETSAGRMKCSKDTAFFFVYSGGTVMVDAVPSTH